MKCYQNALKCIEATSVPWEINFKKVIAPGTEALQKVDPSYHDKNSISNVGDEYCRHRLSTHLGTAIIWIL